MKKDEAKERALLFLKGREYERLIQKRVVSKNYVLSCYKAILSDFPEYKKPDDGNGDEDSFNAGYNSAIDELAKIILDAFGNTK